MLYVEVKCNDSGLHTVSIWHQIHTFGAFGRSVSCAKMLGNYMSTEPLPMCFADNPLYYLSYELGFANRISPKTHYMDGND